LCTIPAFRPDLEREVDLIEEVARVRGFEAIPVHDRVTVQIKGLQESERAVRAMGSVLSGLGFFETVTFGFVTPRQAAAFLPTGLLPLAVDDVRRQADGTLRPSTIPSLLACRRKNQDGGAPGGVRLYETASTFAQTGAGALVERRTLALLADVPGVGKASPGPSMNARPRCGCCAARWSRCAQPWAGRTRRPSSSRARRPRAMPRPALACWSTAQHSAGSG
jgi:phenylalanyl-tRNA synthetase beta chain